MHINIVDIDTVQAGMKPCLNLRAIIRPSGAYAEVLAAWGDGCCFAALPTFPRPRVYRCRDNVHKQASHPSFFYP